MFCHFVPWAMTCLLLPSPSPDEPAKNAVPRILQVTKIWDQGKHNAFTDLIRWRDKWYCVFREAEAHVGGDGELRILESSDGIDWKPVGLIKETGVDPRDPHFSITPDDRLIRCRRAAQFLRRVANTAYQASARGGVVK